MDLQSILTCDERHKQKIYSKKNQRDQESTDLNMRLYGHHTTNHHDSVYRSITQGMSTTTLSMDEGSPGHIFRSRVSGMWLRLTPEDRLIDRELGGIQNSGNGL